MSIDIGVNSWATIAEADAYLTNKLDSQPWFALPDSAGAGEESKELYLIMAFYTLVDKQGYYLAPGNTDEDLKKAQTELAFYFIDNYASFVDQADTMNKGVSSFKASKWEEDYFASNAGDFPLPYMVTKFISNYKLWGTTVNLSTGE
jgi:hypothetical protein